MPQTLRSQAQPLQSLSYSSNSNYNFLAVISDTNGISSAQRELKSQQIKLQTQIDVLHQVSN